jgi:hypothetical protein
MNPLRDAILLNNAGVQLLNRGSLEQALHSFQCAVSSIKVATTNASFENPQTLFDASNASGRFNHREVAAHGAETNMAEAKLRLDGLKNGVSYVFNRPLLIPTGFSIYSMEQLNSVILSASTYIVFNFALACHFCGKMSGREVYLMRAARLYELTLKVLGSAEARSCPNHGTMPAILECLTLNNLAQMYYEQCDYKTCQIYMDAMYDLFMTAERLDAFLDTHEMEEIMLNLVYLQSPPVAKAA